MTEDHIITKEIIRRAKEILQKSINQSVAHRWEHAERVWKEALNIADEEDVVYLEVLKIAALLHDIDHPYNKKKEHVQRSVRKARQILMEVGYPNDKLKRVLEAISTHSSEDVKAPKTIEGRILLDADKLDGVGATGIARVLTFCGQCGMTPNQALKWYKIKIKKAAPLLQTIKGRRLISERLEYVSSFVKQYEKENTNQVKIDIHRKL